MINIYVGNLPYRITEDGLRQTFEKYGEVVSVKLVKDKETGKSKGFGFVEMSNEEDGKKAIAELNGFSLMQRDIVVNEARPREEKPRQFSGAPRRFNNRENN